VKTSLFTSGYQDHILRTFKSTCNNITYLLYNNLEMSRVIAIAKPEGRRRKDDGRP